MQGAVRFLHLPCCEVVKMKKGKDKFFDAIHTIEEFCWQFRPDCEGCPLVKNNNEKGFIKCVIRARLPYSEKEVRKRIEEWDNEQKR